MYQQPRPKNLEEVYKRINGIGQKVDKPTLESILLNTSHYWADMMVKKEQLRKEREQVFNSGMSDFIFQLENDILVD